MNNQSIKTNMKQIINYMRYSQDNSLIILSTEKGYMIYDTQSFKIVSQLTRIQQELIGNITLGAVLYKAKLIFFVGKDNNKTYLSTQLTIWDDDEQELFGKLAFRRKITYITVTKLIIVIAIGISLYLFDIKTLHYIQSIDSLYYNPYKEIPLCITNHSILAFISHEHDQKTMTKLFVIVKFQRLKQGILGKQSFKINTNFSEVQKLGITKDGLYLLIVSHYGNKIHIYSTENYTRKYCLFTGPKINLISTITFDSKGKFLLLITKTMKMSIYLITNNSQLLLCDCEEHDDQLIIQKNEESKSYFQIFVDEISKKLFDNGIEPFCDIDLPIDNMSRLLYVDFKRKAKDEIVVFYNNGIIKKIKFNRKIKSQCWIESSELISNICL